MAHRKPLESIRAYWLALETEGIDPEFVILYGSHARGDANTWSDIDVVVVTPEFDGEIDRSRVQILWRVAARVDSRIEPIPCGRLEWENDDGRPILEHARREGLRIDASKAA